MKEMPQDIILRPVITEKSSRLMEQNKYTFEVHPRANKIEVRNAVTSLFKVKVVKVSTIYVRSKPKRMGAFLGKSRSWKKAVVTVAAGERIEFFEGANA
ncbi:MAG: 50S ribosomal protein L23 [Thermovirgaceae bacterium]|nr:50S ribosomal protein L23 [Thermovirgaceae bacterium]